MIDCARDPDLIRLVMLAPSHACLFAGRQDKEMDAVSPFIVDMASSQRLSNEWQARGRGHNWGVIARSDRSLDELRRHFRQFLLVQLPDSRKVMFRFYDPRVLRAFLPTCQQHELANWFAGIESLLIEQDDGRMAAYRFDGQRLVIE